MSHVQPCSPHRAQSFYDSRSSQEIGLMNRHIQEALKEGRPLRPAELALFQRMSPAEQRAVIDAQKGKYRMGEGLAGVKDGKLGALINQLVGVHRATEAKVTRAANELVSQARATKAREQNDINAFLADLTTRAQQAARDTLQRLDAREEHRGRSHHRGSRPAGNR